ncbi:hypothetical protein ES708_01432 [subsurface metagenome]
MLPQVVKLKRAALDLLFPRWCVGCGREGSFICYSCRQTLPRIVPPLCPKCGRPQPSGVLCPHCVSWQAEIDGIRSPFRFEGVIQQAIYKLKYGNIRALAQPLVRLLRDYLLTYPVSGKILVPVPLHPKRLRERGYNQSGLLARELGNIIGLPVIDDCLVRLRHTSPQVKTSTVTERQNNVAGAFSCRGDGLRDKQVLLIDDVLTSGATLDACAAALKAGGATSVWGLTLAREI